MFSESFKDAWRQRFGDTPDFEYPELAVFLRHRSVRQYENLPISDSLIQTLVAAAQSAATSSNLQLWSIVSVQNPETREAIAKVADNYEHIRTCGCFFAFLADHFRLRSAAAQVGEQAEGLDYLEFYTMAVIDAALAAERMVCAAESVGLGICYIGAMRNNPAEIRQLLGLPEHVFATFGLCIGWPKKQSSPHIKPRLSQEAIWFHERYNEEVDVSEYDARMRAFYESEHMKGEVTWSMRSGRRVDNHHLTGREVLKEWLEEQGFNRR